MDAVYCVNVRGGAHPALARSLLCPGHVGEYGAHPTWHTRGPLLALLKNVIKLLTNGKCPGVNGSPTFILVDSDKKSLSKFDVAKMDLHAATAHVYPSWMFQTAASGRQKHCCESLNRNDINYLIS